MKKSLFKLSIGIVTSLILFSCGGGSDDPAPPAPDNTVHKLRFYGSELTSPNKVNAVFQLSDQNNMPLSGLLAENVLVTEDGASLTATEADFAIKTSDDFDYSMFVTLLIDANSLYGSNFSDVQSAAKELITKLPSGSSIKLYSYTSTINEELDFTTDLLEVNTAIDAIEAGDDKSNLYGAIGEGIASLTDSLNFGSTIVQPGAVVVIAGYADTEGSKDIDEINEEIGTINLFLLSVGSSADSSLNEVSAKNSVVVDGASNLSSGVDIMNTLLDSYESSLYTFSYASEKSGDEEITTTLASTKSEAGDEISFTFTPTLFFVPDSFEIKTDNLRNVDDGSNRNGNVIVRRDVTNDSVDFQLFSGFAESQYKIVFCNRDPAVFNAWRDLSEDPDAIPYTIEEDDFELEMGYQSPYIDPESFDRKYMVIRDEKNRKDVSYIQMTLQ